MSKPWLTGDCFTRAFERVACDDTWKLCHGMPLGTGPIAGIRYPHAWCERDGVVWDPNHNVVVSAELYYAMGEIESVTEYTYNQMLDEARDSGNLGPWRTDLLELADEVDRVMAKKYSK